MEDAEHGIDKVTGETHVSEHEAEIGGKSTKRDTLRMLKSEDMLPKRGVRGTEPVTEKLGAGTEHVSLENNTEGSTVADIKHVELDTEVHAAETECVGRDAISETNTFLTCSDRGKYSGKQGGTYDTMGKHT